jgi:hypothetical protein
MVRNADVQLRKEKARARRREVNSMEIFEKRGRWCVSDEQDKLMRKFSTKKEAEDFVGVETPPVVEILEEEEETPNYVKGKKK